MTTSRTAKATISGKVIHLATISADGHIGINCGAVHFRSTNRSTIRRVADDAEVTCTKCLKATPVEAPEVEAPAEPLTFMQRQRLAGKAR